MNAAGKLARARPLLRLILSGAFLATSLASLAYAVVTAPHQGKDLGFFQQGGRDWLAGIDTIGRGQIPLYPPWAAPMFSPLALLPFEELTYVWLALNIAAAGLTLYLISKLYGSGWGWRERLFLSALLLCWAPFRVTLRVGQISLMITALLLGAVLATRSKKNVLAGVLMGLALCKYSMALPFLLYFVWKRNWKVAGTAALIAAALTEVYSLRLGIPVMNVIQEYVRVIRDVQTAGVSGWTGTTEIKMLLFSLTGGSESLTLVLTIAVSAAALLAMVLVFKRAPRCESTHLACLSLFALWSSYHRTYDSVLCIVPAALLIGFIGEERFRTFAWAGLGGLGLFALSIPGLLTDRLGLAAPELEANPLGFAGLHVERLVVFALFWSLIALSWRGTTSGQAPKESSVIVQGTALGSTT